MIKMVAIDLDGTLLNDSGKINELNKIQIREQTQNGKKIVICTGRAYTAAKQYYNELEIETPIVVCNGAMGYFPKKKLKIWEKNISIKIVEEIIKYLENKSYDYQIYTDEEIYVKKNSVLALKWERENRKLKGDNIIKLNYFENYKKIIRDDISVLKILVYEQNISKQNRLKVYLKNKEVFCVNSQGKYVDIMALGVSKGNGLEKLINYFEFDKDNTMVIGDQDNDISMFENANISVAVSKAKREIKKKATWIVPSNNNSGVAYALRRIL